MKHVLILAVTLCLTVGSVSTAFAEVPEWLTGSPAPIGILAGMKLMDDGDWDPVDQQGCAGIRLDIGAKEWPVLVAFDATYSKDEGSFNNVDVEGNCTDLYLGVRKYFDQGSFQPFIGGGVNWCKAEATARLGAISASADEDGVGFWVSTGVVVPINENFSLGLDLKYAKTEVEYPGIDAEAGGFSPSAIIGFRF
ncbi:MAG TPA: hypothetical protein PKM88_10055 [bacterium]|nr:hypothetical protein [bacterium]